MIKDIAVHLTGSDEGEVRLAYAEALSERFEAHVTGLYAHFLPEIVGAYPSVVIGMDTWFDESGARAAKTVTRLERRFASLSMPHEVRRLDVLAGTAGQALTAEAVTSDLFVGTRPYGDPLDEVHVELAVLFGAGRACLFVPPKRAASPAFGTVLVAWNGRKESARAVAEAMPVLHQAGQVIIATVSENDETISGDDIARHLSRHGIATVIGTVPPGLEGPGRALLDEAGRVGADLLVMGGYGHSRFMEWMLGGATRYVLSNADIPVLMAH